MNKQKFGVVFCHDTLPDGDFRDVVAAVNPTPVVVLSRFAEWDHYLAALRAGISHIVIPKDNEKDLEDIPREALKRLQFYPVSTIDEVLKLAMEPASP